jgi:hypothetical protein
MTQLALLVERLTVRASARIAKNTARAIRRQSASTAGPSVKASDAASRTPASSAFGGNGTAVKRFCIAGLHFLD